VDVEHRRKAIMTSTTPKKVRVPDLARMKQRGDRIVMLTAYDATMARLFDRAFAKQYVQLGQVIVRAAKDYANDVREGLFPKSTLSNQQPRGVPVC